jgi:hypothetical protein
MKKINWDMVYLVLVGGVLWFALITGVLLGYEI